jgi:hypothetical protein
LETELQSTIVVPVLSEDNLKPQLQHPEVMIGTDGADLANTGVPPKTSAQPRNLPPRAGPLCARAGASAARGDYSQEEIIHKMSGLPAEKPR